MREYFIANLGCKVNRVESDYVERLLQSKGLIPGQQDHAEIIVVNTCTVTSEAEKKTRKVVHGLLTRNPSSQIIVTGCSVAIHPEVYEKMSNRIKVVSKYELIDYLNKNVALIDAPYEDSLTENEYKIRLKNVRRGIKVQDGCDNACTYCIVHTARGKSISYPASQIISTALEYVDSGCPEIVLTGINLGAYQFESYNLTKLVKSITDLFEPHGAIPKTRLRISSVEPDYLDNELVSYIASSEGLICKHLHLPLQSGSSKVLKEMNRHYSAEDFQKLIDTIYSICPGMSLSTDVIVGFPGETDNDFNDTLEMVKYSHFSKVHVFPYSKRENTPAAARNDQVDNETKKQRASIVRSLSESLRLDDLEKRKGSSELAVVLPKGIALTDSYHEVAVDDTFQIGSMIRYNF